MMLDRLKNRLKDEDYDLSFQEFIKRLNIEEDFKKYEDAYIKEAVHIFDFKVQQADTCERYKAFKDSNLVLQAKKNLPEYIKLIVNSEVIEGYRHVYNVVLGVSIPVAKLVAECLSDIRVFTEVRNEAETDRPVVLAGVYSKGALSTYNTYVGTLKRKMNTWFCHYLSSHTLECIDGSEVGNDEDWDFFKDRVAELLTHIAIYTVQGKGSGAFTIGMHSIYDVAILRFILSELKTDLGIRVFYDGNDKFNKDLYSKIFENVHFGSTYERCFNKSALTDIGKRCYAYDRIANALYNEELYLSIEGEIEADAKLNKISLIADALYDKDSYLIAVKGTKAEKNIDQIIKSNPEYSAFYSVEL